MKKNRMKILALALSATVAGSFIPVSNAQAQFSWSEPSIEPMPWDGQEPPVINLPYIEPSPSEFSIEPPRSWRDELLPMPINPSRPTFPGGGLGW